ncbi:MAG: MoaD/ThiS family protein [Thermoplasmata archaeon]
MVKVIILNPVKKEFEIENVKTVFDILKKLNLNVDGYIALFNGMPIPEDESIDGKEKIELLQVFSGG